MSRNNEPFVGSVPMKAKGCPWECWSGVIGISEKLVVFDADAPVGFASDLSVKQRRALALHMIALWARFADGGSDA